MLFVRQRALRSEVFDRNDDIWIRSSFGRFMRDRSYCWIMLPIAYRGH